MQVGECVVFGSCEVLLIHVNRDWRHEGEGRQRWRVEEGTARKMICHGDVSEKFCEMGWNYDCVD